MSKLFEVFGEISLKANGVPKQLDDIDKQAKGVAGTLEHTGTSAVKSSKSFTDMGSTGKTSLLAVAESAGVVGIAVGALVAVVAGVAGTVGNLVNKADQFNATMDKLQAQTGASTEEMQALKDSVENVYMQGLGDSLDQVAQAMGNVKQSTGLVGEELEKATANAMRFEEMFGKSVDESVKVADTLMKNFSISQEEAFNLMTQGIQNGADKSGDFFDTLNEYSVYFKQLGFDANQFTNVLIDGAKNGAFNVDQVGDSIKEFGIRVKDGSATTKQAFEAMGMDANKMALRFAQGGESAQQAFKEVMEALNKIQDPVQKNIVGVELFGTQFEDMETRVISGFANISNTADKSKKSMDEINNLKWDNVGNNLTKLGREFEVKVLLPIGEKFLPYANRFVNGLVDMFHTVMGYIDEFKNDNADMLEGLGTAFSHAFDVIGNIISVAGGLIKVLWNNQFKPMLTVVGSVLGAVVDTINIIVDVILAIIDTFGAVLNGEFDRIGAIWSSTWERITGSWVNIVKSAVGLIKGLMNDATDEAQYTQGMENFSKGYYDDIEAMYGTNNAKKSAPKPSIPNLPTKDYYGGNSGGGKSASDAQREEIDNQKQIAKNMLDSGLINKEQYAQKLGELLNANKAYFSANAKNMAEHNRLVDEMGKNSLEQSKRWILEKERTMRDSGVSSVAVVDMQIEAYERLSRKGIFTVEQQQQIEDTLYDLRKKKVEESYNFSTHWIETEERKMIDNGRSAIEVAEMKRQAFERMTNSGIYSGEKLEEIYKNVRDVIGQIRDLDFQNSFGWVDNLTKKMEDMGKNTVEIAKAKMDSFSRMLQRGTDNFGNAYTADQLKQIREKLYDATIEKQEAERDAILKKLDEEAKKYKDTVDAKVEAMRKENQAKKESNELEKERLKLLELIEERNKVADDKRFQLVKRREDGSLYLENVADLAKLEELDAQIKEQQDRMNERQSDNEFNKKVQDMQNGVDQNNIELEAKKKAVEDYYKEVIAQTARAQTDMTELLAMPAINIDELYTSVLDKLSDKIAEIIDQMEQMDYDFAPVTGATIPTTSTNTTSNTNSNTTTNNSSTSNQGNVVYNITVNADRFDEFFLRTLVNNTPRIR